MRYSAEEYACQNLQHSDHFETQKKNISERLGYGQKSDRQIEILIYINILMFIYTYIYIYIYIYIYKFVKLNTKLTC